MEKWGLGRTLIVCLGGFWLLDGILQLQPGMFTSAFVTTVLVPNLQGQPHILAGIISFGIRIFSINIVWSNLIAAFIQLLIGSLLIVPLWVSEPKKTLRLGLWLSVVWALIVWIFGEGLGGLATGMATFATGAPGSALLYLILALFILDAMNEGVEAPLQRLPAAAGILFLFSATLNFAPMFWQAGMLNNLLTIGVLLCLGLFLILVPDRPVAWITVLFLAAVWWLGQNFGGLQTFPAGLATDPNSAPLFILFLLPIFFMAKGSPRPRS